MSDNNLDRMMKNDVALERLEEVCRERGYRLVLDCEDILIGDIAFVEKLRTVFINTYVSENSLRIFEMPD